MSITSDEVNLLVYKYLVESGFLHTAFAFANEAKQPACGEEASGVPPGALVAAMQKGLLYSQTEAHIQEDGTVLDCENPFSLVRKHVCSSSSGARKRGRDVMDVESTGRATRGGDADASADDDGAAVEAIGESQVVRLEGHASEVFNCAWNPTSGKLVLASGSGDGTARLWRFGAGWNLVGAPLVLRSGGGDLSASSKEGGGKEGGSQDVTALGWNRNGTLLATGSCDGVARIWTESGQLVQSLKRHTGPIFSLKWNRSGTRLLSGSVDKSVVVWDAAQGTVQQSYELHTQPTLDVDWRDDSSFASCSSDHLIHVCALGSTSALQTFRGHSDEVNAIRWNGDGSLLASCSDDHTVKLWGMSHAHALFDMREHAREVYSLQWSPTGPGTANPDRMPLLASASFDASVKLWNVEVGRCVRTLARHVEAVYTVAFSPDGKYLATGSLDKSLLIWNVSDGALVRSYRGSSGIFDVSWSVDGSHLAACFASGSVHLLDPRF